MAAVSGVSWVGFVFASASAATTPLSVSIESSMFAGRSTSMSLSDGEWGLPIVLATERSSRYVVQKIRLRL